MNEQIFFVEEIEKRIINFLEPYKKIYENELFDFYVINQIDVLEVYGKHKNEYKKDEQTEFLLLRMCICQEWEQIHISNIFITQFMQHNCIGKKLINEVFNLAEKNNYELFLVDMVPSFYRRMLMRGALPCEDYDDVLKIVKETKLS